MSKESKKDILKKIYILVVRQIKDPVFAVALSISVFMWFLNSLAGNFTTVISIPINIEGAVNEVSDADGKRVEKTNNIFTVDCKVSGKGYNILYYSIFSKITINTAEIKVEKSSAGEYVVDMASLENKLNENLKGITLLTVFQKRLAFRTLTYSSKEVPVVLDVDVKNDGQFMQVGNIVLEPSHITISANISKLDSINEVFTKHLRIENKEKNLSGEIDLIDINDVTFSTNHVYYAMSFQRFTEKKIMKKVEVKHANNVHYSVIPSHVEVVMNIAEDIYQDFNHLNFPLYVDIRDKNSDSPNSNYLGDNKFLVEYSHLPKGVKVRAINPIYVTVLKGGVDTHRGYGVSGDKYSKEILDLFNQKQ